MSWTTDFLDFVHRLKTHNVSKTGSVLVLSRTKPLEVSSFKRTQLSRCPSSLHLRTKTDPVFETLCFLEYQTMDKVQKRRRPDCNTPSSEPFGIYLMSCLTGWRLVHEYRCSITDIHKRVASATRNDWDTNHQHSSQTCGVSITHKANCAVYGSLYGIITSYPHKLLLWSFNAALS
jgi:hypothetical protein